MTPSFQSTLYSRYPSIFREKDLPPSQTCMCWGISCDDGWFTILDSLCAALSSESWSESWPVKADYPDSDIIFRYDLPEVVATQVKEKFASLRFYHRVIYPVSFLSMEGMYPITGAKIRARLEGYISGVIQMAESLSRRTCEVSGRPGERCVRNGWWKTLCVDEAARLGFVLPSAG